MKRRAALRRTLVMMVKVPVAGQVKTRLARDVGPPAALGFYRHLICNLASRLRAPRLWSFVLAVSPGAGRHTRALPPHTCRTGQVAGDLGRRMQAVFDRTPPGPVIIIGSDVPGITAGDIACAFQRLEGCAAVIGPSPDGGYWLIGLRRRPRSMRPFANVPWSTSEALAGTLRNLAGHRVALLRELADIDTAADWQTHTQVRSRRIMGPGSRPG